MKVKVLCFLCVLFFVSQIFIPSPGVKASEEKKGALILVNYDKEKSLFSELIAREENYDFSIDIFSLQEKKVSKSSPSAIRKFLWSQKDNYQFFVLDEELAYGEINEGGVITDYYYAHREGFFSYTKESADYFGRSVERYPELILSRIRRNQIGFYSVPKKRVTSIQGVFGLPFVFFNRDQPACGVGTFQVELSYTGDVFKREMSKLNPNIKITTLYDDKSSRISGKYLTDTKPRKKPDLTLSQENFLKVEKQKNFFFLFNTPEPLYNEEITNIYNDTFTSALWNDKNKDSSAMAEEITRLDLKNFAKMNEEKIFSFYFVPTPNRIDYINAPLIITPAFTYGEESDPTDSLTYFVDDDPEKSSISAAWNAILMDIANGKTFAESVLSGYANYFKIVSSEKDEWAQGVNATRLGFYGLPWYTINDLLPQPEIQLEKLNYQVIGSEVSIPMKNVGDLDLMVNIQSDLIEPMESLVLKSNESKNLILKHKKEDLQWPRLRMNRTPRKSSRTLSLQTNSLKHPNIELTIEFWE